MAISLSANYLPVHTLIKRCHDDVITASRTVQTVHLACWNDFGFMSLKYSANECIWRAMREKSSSLTHLLITAPVRRAGSCTFAGWTLICSSIRIVTFLNRKAAGRHLVCIWLRQVSHWFYIFSDKCVSIYIEPDAALALAHSHLNGSCVEPAMGWFGI